MIIVTGTKRSGTSMWMQLLEAAGVQVFGEEFPGVWGDTIRDANKHGFYESYLRKGIFYGTNPHPKNGQYIPPNKSRGLAVKVFIPGLVRTDIAYVDRVMATVRNWREYSGSLNRLLEMEDENLREMGKRKDDRPAKVSPILEWWLQNYMLVRNVAIRGLPAHFVTYDRVLDAPADVLPPALSWLGVEEEGIQSAIEQVDSGARTQTTGEAPDDLTGEQIQVFDEFYGLLHEGEQIPVSFIKKLNETHLDLMERIETEFARVRNLNKTRRMKRLRELNPNTVERLSGNQGSADAIEANKQSASRESEE
jgi:uncharacterized protein YjiS (DUF1127 family)